MSARRLLVPVLVALALGVAACGGGSSGGGGSSASTAVSASGGSAATGSAQAFCDTFSSAKDFAGIEGLPSKDDLARIKTFADDLDSTAPAEIKSDVAVLTAYFRFIADAAANLGSNPTTEPSGLGDQMAKVVPAVTRVSIWSAAHCTGFASTASSAASAAASTVASAASAAASAAASVAASISAAISSALSSALANPSSS